MGDIKAAHLQHTGDIQSAFNCSSQGSRIPFTNLNKWYQDMLTDNPPIFQGIFPLRTVKVVPYEPKWREKKKLEQFSTFNENLAQENHF